MKKIDWDIAVGAGIALLLVGLILSVMLQPFSITTH